MNPKDRLSINGVSGTLNRLPLIVSVAVLSCLCALAPLSEAEAGTPPGTASIKRPDVSLRIPDLTFSEENLSVEEDGNEDHDFAQLEGSYLAKNWVLIAGSSKIPRDSDGHFKTKIEIRGKEEPLTLTSIGPNGDVRREILIVSYPGYQPHFRNANEEPKRQAFSVSLGPTHLTYSQSASSLSQAFSFSESAVTLKAMYNFLVLPPYWELGLAAFVSTITFLPSISGTTMRSLGFNVRIGYKVPFVHSPWSVSLMFGGYFTTLYVNPASFGFQNLSGPQLFPVIHRKLGDLDNLSLYLKYSPVSDGFFSLAPSSREIAGGLTYSHSLSNRHSIPISLDLSDLKSVAQATSADGSTTTNVPLELTTVSLSVGYTF